MGGHVANVCRLGDDRRSRRRSIVSVSYRHGLLHRGEAMDHSAVWHSLHRYMCGTPPIDLAAIIFAATMQVPQLSRCHCGNFLCLGNNRCPAVIFFVLATRDDNRADNRSAIVTAHRYTTPSHSNVSARHRPCNRSRCDHRADDHGNVIVTNVAVYLRWPEMHYANLA